MLPTEYYSAPLGGVNSAPAWLPASMVVEPDPIKEGRQTYIRSTNHDSLCESI